MVEAKTQLLWLETTKKQQKLGRNRGITKTQLGFSLHQKHIFPCLFELEEDNRDVDEDDHRKQGF